MQQLANVITNQKRMHKVYPLNVITKYHTPQKQRTHYIYNKRNESGTNNIK